MNTIVNGIKMRYTRGGTALVAALMFAPGCSDHPLYSNSAYLELELSPSGYTIPVIGRALEFTVIARDAGGRIVRPALLEWVSSDTLVATVDGTGRLTSRRDGVTMVVVRAGDVGIAAAQVFVEANVESEAWLVSVQNGDTDAGNNRSRTEVSIHEGGNK